MRKIGNAQKLLALLLLILGVLAGAQEWNRKKVGHPKVELNEVSEFQGVAMTVPYRILVGHPLDDQANVGVEEVIRSTFAEIDQIYNKWNPSSELSQFNRWPANLFFPASRDLLNFLNRTAGLVELTQGRFDPTVESIQGVWKESLERGEMPQDETLKRYRAAVGWDNLVLTPDTLLKKDDLTQLDLGGIAKGYCVDLLTERLEELGYQNLLIDWGGELTARGAHPSGRQWNVAIRGIEQEASIEATTALQNIAIACSGDYYQFWTIENKGNRLEFFHIVDPFTGYLLEKRKDGIASISVTAMSCMEADAIATAMMLYPDASDAKAWGEELKRHVPGFQYWILNRIQPIAVG
jgi:thiamine biosynthesis lipoprotein